MRVYKSNEGLLRPVRNSIRNAQTSLRNASNVDLNAPSGFSYASRLRNLDTKINKWNNKLSKMYTDLENADRTYNELINEGINNISNISEIRLNRRRGVKGIGE